MNLGGSAGYRGDNALGRDAGQAGHAIAHSNSEMPPLGEADRVGPYEILAAIGQGAMGAVYLAKDSRLSRRVAIKVISAEAELDLSRRRRFVQEARAASALNHPNIVTVHDFGTENGLSYIVTELVEGESLRKAISRGA